DLVRLYRNIGIEFLYPAMALTLGLAALCFFRAGNARFTRAFDLDKLMAEQARSSRAMPASERASRARPIRLCMSRNGSRDTRKEGASSMRRAPAASLCGNWVRPGRD